MGSPATRRARSRVTLAAAAAFALAFSPSGRTATLAASEGGATIRVGENKIEPSGATPLPEGAVIFCGEGARAVVEFAPGLLAVLLPNTKLVIGATDSVGPGVGSDGSPLPSHAASCELGTIVLLATDRGLGAATLELSTPKGKVSPVLPGRVAVLVGPSAEGSPVTVAAPTGVVLLTAQGGEQTPLPRGMGMALGAKRPASLADLPKGAQLEEAADAAAASPLVSASLPSGAP